jgi:hypothetical protein
MTVETLFEKPLYVGMYTDGCKLMSEFYPTSCEYTQIVTAISILSVMDRCSLGGLFSHAIAPCSQKRHRRFT